MPGRCFKILFKKIIFLLLLAIPFFGKAIPHSFINQPFNDTLLCAGGPLRITFTATPIFFDSTNSFTAQLSDANGNFNNPVNIGTINTAISYFVNCTIPANTTPGALYRVRLVSSSPKDTSADNGKPIRISVYPLLTIISNSPVCPGTGSILYMNCGTNPASQTFSWQGPNNFTSTSQNIVINNVQFSDSGKYIVTANRYGCKSKDSFNALVMVPPNARIIPQGIINVCEGDNFGLTDSNNVPNVRYSWKGPNNFSSIGIGSSAFTYVNIPSKYTGWFVLTASLNGVCASKDSVWLNVFPRPDSPSISSNSPICFGNAINLYSNTMTPGSSFIWHGPNGFTTTTQNPIINNATYANAGIYYGSVKHPNGCISKESKLNIIVGTPVTPPTISGNNMLCKGDSLLLTANSPHPGTFKWVGPASNILPFNKNLAIGNITTADAGTYSVTLDHMGCTSAAATSSIIITNVPEPIATNNGPLCDGYTLELKAIDIPNASYDWKGPGNFSSTQQNPTISSANLNTEGIYLVKASILNCSNSSTTYATINPIPAVRNISSNTPVCIGSTLNLHAESTISGSSFSWRGPNGFSAMTQDLSLIALPGSAGRYYAKTTAKGCTSEEESILVQTKELPAVPIVTNNGPLYTTQTLYLYASSATKEATFTWKGPLGFTASEADVSISDITTDYGGEYIVTATYDGCISTGKTDVVINALTNSVFTLFPNPNKGSFSITGYTKTNSPVFMEIINMNGQVVYRRSSLPILRRFNITVDKGDLANGPYLFYISTVEERKTFRFIVNK